MAARWGKDRNVQLTGPSDLGKKGFRGALDAELSSGIRSEWLIRERIQVNHTLCKGWPFLTNTCPPKKRKWKSKWLSPNAARIRKTRNHSHKQDIKCASLAQFKATRNKLKYAVNIHIYSLAAHPTLDWENKCLPFTADTLRITCTHKAPQKSSPELEDTGRGKGKLGQREWHGLIYTTKCKIDS